MTTTKITFLVEPEPDGGYVARALGTSIITQADDKPGLRDAVRDAVRCHEDGQDVPSTIRLCFVRGDTIVL